MSILSPATPPVQEWSSIAKPIKGVINEERTDINAKIKVHGRNLAGVFDYVQTSEEIFYLVPLFDTLKTGTNIRIWNFNYTKANEQFTNAH